MQTRRHGGRGKARKPESQNVRRHGLLIFRLSGFLVFWLSPPVLGLMLLIMLIRPEESLAAWPDDPEMNLPICMADGTQEHPRIDTDGASGAVIVWQDISPTSSDIYAQRVDARGEIRWTRDGVGICLEKGEQWHPDLVYDGAGGAIIAWWDKRVGYSEMDIYAQRVNSNGEVQWQPGGVPICTAPKFQQELDIIADGEGGAIIAWHDYRFKSGTPYIYAQRVNADGEILWERDGVIIAGEEGYQKYPVLASDGNGGAIIAWQDWRDGKGDIYAQRIDADGKTLWHKSGVPVCEMPERQWHPAITADDEGGAIIVWMDHRNHAENNIISRADHGTEAGWDIYAQRVNDQGTAMWQENGMPVCLIRGDQYDYSLMGNGTDGAFIAWHDQRTADWDIYIQKLNDSGNPEWTKGGLAVCTESGNQYNPTIVSDGADGVIITWWDKRNVHSDIYAQRIDARGNMLWANGSAAICLAEGNQQDPQPVNSGVGSAIIAWWDMRRVDADIYAQRVISE